MTDLRRALGEAVEDARRGQEERGQDEERSEESLAPEPGTERHEHAMDLLTAPNIPDRAAHTMELLGHVGERLVKMLAFVCAVSARAGYPIQPSTHAESSAGKNFLWDTVLLLLPVAMVLRWSSMSDKALFFTEEDLKGKVIYLQEVAGSKGADFAIRVLQSAQYLEYVVTEKTADGSYKAVTYRKEGPVVVVQTTTQIRLFNENDTRVFPIYLDESAEQTRRIVENALEKAEAGGLTVEDREGMLQEWHDAVLLLEPAEVVIPYARRIKVPFHRVRVRRDVTRLLDVIRVLAWLHQHARERDELGRVLATEEDFRMALALVSDSLGRAWGSMSPAEEAVMGAIRSLPEAVRKNGFTRGELSVGDRDARRVQDVLKALTESGHIECDRRPGPGGYRYTVPRDPGESVLGISLNPRGDDGDADDEGPEEADAEEDPEPGRDTGQKGEESVSRAIARTDNRAIEGPYQPQKKPIARGRGEDDERGFGDDSEEEDPDHLGRLTALGWHRAPIPLPAEDDARGAKDEDAVAYALRHRIPVYHGRPPESWEVVRDDPLVVSAGDVADSEPKGRGEEKVRAASGWPSTPGEMAPPLARAVALLRSKAHRFWDPGFDEWAFDEWASVSDPEKACKEAYLHAELWRNEHTSEELWSFVALRRGRSAPEREIESSVWSRVNTGQSILTPVILPEVDFEL